ncbi:hypothetical protein VYU27_000298 [Nannochloropsis oceanica]
MADMHSTSAAGELEELMQDTVKFIGGVADKLWTAGTSAKDMLLDGEKKGDGNKSKERSSLGFYECNGVMETKSFEDLDMLESGHAREYITDECLLPCPTLKRWSTCNVVKDGKTAFRMYLDETHTRFMLSAKRVGDSFYISQYESFPDSVDDVPDLYYCAVLRTCSEGHFKLFLNGCEACDRKTDKYTCGSGDRCDDRQLLAEINHSVRRVKEANADMRCLSIKLPKIHEDKQSREVWCPRMNQLRRQVGDLDKAGHVRLMNKLPEWNEALQSLVLRFNKGRVLAPSAKNFLICMMAGQDKREGVLQFGKTRKRRYALDFRHPISPLQAFGICLSLFKWNI